MNSGINFDFFYGSEAEQFRFLRVPYVLFTDKEHFGQLSYGARLLYAMLLERMNLSRQNKWLDEENRVYIIFTIEEICDKMCCSKPTAVKMLKELDDETGVGLISKKRRGTGLASIIYVRKFITDSCDNHIEPEKDYCDYQASDVSSVVICEPAGKEILHADSKFLHRELNNFNTNYIDNNYTDINYSVDSINQSLTCGTKNFFVNDGIDRNEVEENVKKQIEYDCLASHQDESIVRMIEEVKDLMIDVLCGERAVVIGGQKVSAESAKAAFSKITYEHVVYVLHNLLNYPDRISRIDRFIIASLYNSAFTFNSSVFSGFEYRNGFKIL